MGLELCPPDAEEFVATDALGREHVIRAWATDTPTYKVCARYRNGTTVFEAEAPPFTANELVAVAEVAATLAREYRTTIQKIVRRAR